MRHMFFSILFFLTCFSLSGQEPTHDLKSDPAAGTYTFSLSSVSEMTVQMGGMTIPSKSDQKQTWEWVVGEPDAEGVQEYRMQLQRMTMTNEAKGNVIAEYDSDDSRPITDPQLKVMSAIFNAMKSTPVFCKIRNGKIESCSGLNEMWDQLAGADEKMAPVINMFKQQMGEEMLQGMIDMGNKSMPDSPVKVGESWTNEQKLPMPMVGKMNARSTSTLKDVRDENGRQTAFIETEGDLKLEEAGKENPAQFTKLENTFSATGEFDLNSHMLRRNETIVHMDTEMEVGAGEKTQNVILKGLITSILTIEKK